MTAHKMVNGVKVYLTQSEIDSKDAEVASDIAKKEANAWKVNRVASYPSLGDQLDSLVRDIQNGTVSTAGEFFTANNAVKIANPKPGV